MTNNEINKKMAEFMGWRVDNNGNCWDGDILETTLHESSYGSWNPTNNISDAWMVVEIIQSYGYRIILKQIISSGEWECLIYKPILAKDNYNHKRIKAKSAPMAICLAVLEMG